MQPLESIKKIKESKIFLDWEKTNPDNYLVHAFKMIEHNSETGWQLGFYLKSKDRMVTFFAEPDISISPEEEIFKEDERKIPEVDENDIKIDYQEALNVAKKFQEENFKNDAPQKTIIILQNLGSGAVFNLTYITQRFNTLNIKIDAKSANVLDHKLTSILSMAETLKDK